jgi:two-component system invasion response regulator UvrY
MGNKKNIVIVDDHILVRDGLKALIEKLGPYEVSHQFDNGPDFLESLPFKPEPDLIILDISMPGMNGDEVMEILKARNIEIPVLVLTLDQKEDLIIKLFRLGARGYLEKKCKSETMKRALEEIFERGYYHNEFLTLSLQNNAISNKKEEHTVILEKLSQREKTFLKLVCHEEEYTYEQIADCMHMSTKSIHKCRDNISLEFGIKSKTGLVLFVMKYKLFEYL